MADAVTKICDPARYRLQDAIARAKSLARADPDVELHFVRFLQAQCLSRNVPLPIVFRGLDVFDGILDGRMDESRLFVLLRPFLRCGDPQIASKCVLVLGRHSRSMAWLRKIMAAGDDRIRANLIESLWSRKEPAIERILRDALEEAHQRVVANAIFGLYLRGAEDWPRGLERLVGSDDIFFRRSGIWMLRSSGAPEAPARLKLLIRDADNGVRHAAFAALIHLRESGSRG